MSIHRRQTFLKAQIVELDRLLDSIGDHPLMSISHRQRKEELEEELKSLREVDDAIPMHEQPLPLALTLEQQSVLAALQSKETEEYPLSKWYLGALYALENPHNPDRVSQAAQSLRELVEKLPRVVREMDAQGTAFDFAGMRRDINVRLLKDKERYPEGWKGQGIDSRLDKTLQKVERYVELNRQPTRKEQMQRAVTDIDPMVDQLDSGVREAKRNRLHDLWQRLEGFAHHKRSPDVEKFRESMEMLERAVFDLLAPITAQDQREIQSILALSERSERDVERMLELIERRGANFAFFFQRVNDASWLPILGERGYFAHPPNVEPAGDGRVSFPLWWPIRYLATVSTGAPDAVIELALQLPKVDNPRVYEDILDIALRLHGEQSAKLKPKILEYASIEYQFLAFRYAELLAHWTAEQQITAALDLAKALVQFVPDPDSESKQARRKENPKDWTTLLAPRPRFNQQDYQEILEKGVRPLAERDPYQAARLLVSATANMIRLQTYQEDIEKGKGEDGSEVWWRRLDKQEDDYHDPKETLVHTLTFACEQVFEKAPELIASLDDVLRKQRWKIFTRLRHHLYALHPNEQTKPWIREAVLAHEDYGRWEYHYEFQQMIRCAREHFGAALLTEEERTQIFDAILSGPSKADSQEWMGEQFTEERFKQRQHHFHRMQLKPFAPVLFGEYAAYFQRLEAKADEQISDDAYSPVGKIEAGSISQRSPQSPEALADLADETLLAYINEWQEGHRDKSNWQVEITIEALAEAFQTVFKDSIIPDAGRLRFWIDNREQIERPIYVRAMISAMQEHVKAEDFDKLNEWLTFCDWVLAHPDQEHEEGYGDKLSEESREHPHWHSARRAVGDFVGVCIAKDVNVPISAREHLAKLLGMLCTQFDWRLDEDKPVLLNRSDQLTEAINNTRSRALESLVNFGFWLRRHDPEADVSEVTAVLEKRFAPETEHPLSLPERAMLGLQYQNIFNLAETWATEHKGDFFPKGDLPAWMEAFDNFLRYNRPSKLVFEILRGNFELALRHARRQERLRGELVDPLGRHLFTYYLWDVYPLKGKASLLERYYQGTEREQWANVFDYVGRVLRGSGKSIDPTLKERTIKFVEWRLEAKEPTELEHFASWLEAECLDPDWRLDTYSRILNVVQSKGMRFFDALTTLETLLPDHTAKVVECFAKMTDAVLKSDALYMIQSDQAKTILKAGLESSDESVRNDAERACENLLRGGRFDFLDTGA